MEKKEHVNVAVSIDIDDVLEKVYAASAWHAVGRAGGYVITPDNAAMLRVSALIIAQTLRAAPMRSSPLHSSKRRG